MRLSRATVLVVLLASFAAAAQAQVNRTGSIPQSSSGSGVADAMEQGWQVGGLECSRGTGLVESPTLFVTALTGPCVGRRLQLDFLVTAPGGLTENPHTFEYEVACQTVNPAGFGGGGPVLSHSYALDGEDLQPINNGTFVFGEITVTTAEYAVQQEIVPTLGQWGMIAAAVLLLAGGIWLVATRLG